MAFHRTVGLVACAILLALAAEQAYGWGALPELDLAHKTCIPMCFGNCYIPCRSEGKTPIFCEQECASECERRCENVRRLKNVG
ncbi:hypothetical protein MTO96_020523 [Rhipicephalus appendiculatus]